ncbi:MAG: cysteine synthase A [Kiritimatiellae bacterium]|nr:cysteine synthase A [Kiritimatiellia bacterium]
MKAKNILETLGRTPLVEISKRLNGTAAKVFAKLESFNPGGSAKDRVAVSMIEAAEQEGKLKPGATIIEPTSGNTGVGLALASAVKGYRLVLVMPDTMSVERRRLAAAYGAEVVLTPGTDGMKGCLDKAAELNRAIPGSFIPNQFGNPANVAAHVRTTGPEIWEDLGGQVDAFVAGVGTGGTLTGVGRFLRSKNPGVKLYAVEPDTSPLISKGVSGSHRLQGIGANFIPSIFDRSLVDEVICVSAKDAGETARALGAKEGVLCGITSGAAMWAALTLAKRPEFAGKTIVALLPDTGERYLSTWLFES